MDDVSADDVMGVGGMAEGGGYTAAGMEEFEFAGGEFDEEGNFDEFQPEFFGAGMDGQVDTGNGANANNVGNIVDLLLQDLVHSDEDDDDSDDDDDIPLDDGEDDIPLDDGQFFFDNISRSIHDPNFITIEISIGENIL